MSDLDRYQYGYDQNSNRLYKANVVGTAAVGYLDEGYNYDNLNRLTQMQRGNLSSGVITGTPTREMDYTLDPTGNWAAYLTKTAGTTDLNQTRSANKVNEITAIGGTPGWATPPAYDAAGSMTSFPRPASPASNFTATYDAWNRMVSISDTSGAVATYQYDGRGRRIVKYTASIPETRHFYYTSNWEDIEERVGTATTMDQQYVWGMRYIDELVCRDDATPQRLYAMQDANFNLTSIADISGSAVERYLFDPYGNRTVMNASWGVISSSAYHWVIGHQGLMSDEESALIYNRNRYLNYPLGTFQSRDPLQSAGGTNLFEAYNGAPPQILDPLGLRSVMYAFDQFISGSRGTWLPLPFLGSSPIGSGDLSEFETDVRGFGQFNFSRGNPNARLSSFGWIDDTKIGAIKTLGVDYTGGSQTGYSHERDRSSTRGGYGPWVYFTDRAVLHGSLLPIVTNTSPTTTDIRFHVWASYPFVPGPSVEYDITFEFVLCAATSYTVKISGRHTQFPDAEAYVDGHVLYQYTSAFSGPGLYDLNTFTTMSVGPISLPI